MVATSSVLLVGERGPFSLPRLFFCGLVRSRVSSIGGGSTLVSFMPVVIAPAVERPVPLTSKVVGLSQLFYVRISTSDQILCSTVGFAANKRASRDLAFAIHTKTSRSDLVHINVRWYLSALYRRAVRTGQKCRFPGFGFAVVKRGRWRAAVVW